MIENSCIERKQWITHDEMMNITVVAESTPGPIAINCATFTGYKKAGFPGALAATLGIIVPSFIVIYLISMFLDHFLEMTIIANAFKGIKIAVGILILDAAATMIKKMQKIYIILNLLIVVTCISNILAVLILRQMFVQHVQKHIAMCCNVNIIWHIRSFNR